MEPVHIFYKDLPADENNIFIADITEKKEVENVKFKKSLEYAVTGLSINQEIGSDLVTVTLISSIQDLVKERKEADLDLEISKPETRSLVILFQKKSATDCPPIKLTFYNSTTKKKKKKKKKKNEFYHYFEHLSTFGFVWEYSLLDFRYSVELSKNKRNLIRTVTMSKIARKKLFADESRIWNFEEPAAGSPSSMSTNIHKVNFIRLYVDRPTR